MGPRFSITTTCLTLSTLAALAGTASAAVTGTLSWAVQAGTTGYQDPSAVVDTAGNVIVNSLYDPNVTKYNSAGQVLWSTSPAIMYRGQLAGSLSGHVALDSAGNIYVSSLISYVDASSMASALGLAKISPAGTVLWTNSYTIGSGGEHMAGGPVVVGTNGSVYVIGTSANFSQPTAPVAILRVNASTGAFQNSLRSPPPSTVDYGGNMPDSVLVLDSANNVFYGGPEGIRSYSSDLQTLRWASSQVAVRAALVDASNNLYIAGYIDNGPGVDDNPVVRRLNSATGAQAWEARTLGPPPGDRETNGFNALALDSRGQLYAVGAQNINAQTMYKLDAATGAVSWFRGDGGLDMAVALDANDNAYVSGTTAGDALVIVYDPQGHVLWSQLYNGPSNMDDTFVHIAVDNRGGVYAASDSRTGTAQADRIPQLVKYSEAGIVFGGTYRVINRNSGRAMDALNRGTANGTQIDQWSYNGGTNQRWAVTSLGYNQYKIVGVQSGRALDVAGSATSNGTKVELWDYKGNNNQKYTFASTSGGYFRITPAHATGSCIEGAGSSTANGTLVDLWQYNGGNNQQWILQAP